MSSTVLYFCLLWSLSAPSARSDSCSSNCVCFMDDNGDMVAKCNIKRKSEVLLLPVSITKLDISNNNLTELHSWFFTHTPNVTQLSVANNHIKNIKENTFQNLPYLEYVDLTNNSLEQWDVNLSNELARLRASEFTGNPFIPSQRFLKLPMLITVSGITWSQSCQSCLLVRTAVIERFRRIMNVSFCAVTEMNFVFSKEVNYGKSLEFVEKGFSPQCLCVSDQCYESEIANPYNQDLNLIIRYVFYVEYVLGGIAIVLNLLVMLTIMLSRTLKKPSFIMICNIALCDLFIGVYSVLTGRFTVYEFIVNEKKYENLDLFVNHYCTAMGFLFTTSQMVAVPTTLLMSIERYLSIVYCMDPTKRLSKRKTFILIAMFWLCGLSYASFPIFRVGGLRQHGEYTCTLPFVDGEDHMKVNSSTLVIAVVLAMMYLAGSCLYIPIYRYVKTTNSSAGVKRKAALARNIAIMITTNFVFFLLPLISILIFVYSYKSFAELLGVDTLKEVQTYFIFLSWLPVVLLAVNSCLNPFLCAFRHPKFKSQLILLRNILPKTRETSGLPVDARVPGNSSMPANKSTDGIELGITNSTLRISMETITAL